MRGGEVSGGDLSSQQISANVVPGPEPRYYTTYLTCKDTDDQGTHGEIALFQEMRTTNIVPKTSAYQIAVEKASIDTKALPSFIAQVDTTATNHNQLQSLVGFEMNWSGSMFPSTFDSSSILYMPNQSDTGSSQILFISTGGSSLPIKYYRSSPAFSTFFGNNNLNPACEGVLEAYIENNPNSPYWLGQYSFNLAYGSFIQSFNRALSRAFGVWNYTLASGNPWVVSVITAQPIGSKPWQLSLYQDGGDGEIPISNYQVLCINAKPTNPGSIYEIGGQSIFSLMNNFYPVLSNTVNPDDQTTTVVIPCNTALNDFFTKYYKAYGSFPNFTVDVYSDQDPNHNPNAGITTYEENIPSHLVPPSTAIPPPSLGAFDDGASTLTTLYFTYLPGVDPKSIATPCFDFFDGIASTTISTSNTSVTLFDQGMGPLYVSSKPTRTDFLTTAYLLGFLPDTTFSIPCTGNSEAKTVYANRPIAPAFTTQIDLAAYQALFWKPSDAYTTVPRPLPGSSYYYGYGTSYYLSNVVNPAIANCFQNEYDSYFNGDLPSNIMAKLLLEPNIDAVTDLSLKAQLYCTTYFNSASCPLAALEAVKPWVPNETYAAGTPVTFANTDPVSPINNLYIANVLTGSIDFQTPEPFKNTDYWLYCGPFIYQTAVLGGKYMDDELVTYNGFATKITSVTPATSTSPRIRSPKIFTGIEGKPTTLVPRQNYTIRIKNTATGGDAVVEENGYTYHIFNQNGTFTLTSSTSLYNDIGGAIVGGGGGGGATNGGGGGGGGAVGKFTFGQLIPNEPITITIGAGGSGQSTNVNGANGGTTSFQKGSDAVVPAPGGGGGAGNNGGGNAAATGGVITTVGAYTFHTFTSNGTFTPLSAAPLAISYVLVGGGGAGGSGQGGGGGGGGKVLQATATLTSTTALPVVVGAGGVIIANTQGSSGGATSFNGSGVNGGSGGGGSANINGGAVNGNSGGGATPGGNPGTVSPGSGFYGGYGNAFSGGGGGGNASAGSEYNNASSLANGGDATQVTLNSSIYFFGGGGGGGGLTVQGGSGGNGLGGHGGSPTQSATAGASGTGGGGGGAGIITAGGNGGSGTVVISYLTPAVASPGSTGGSGGGGNGVTLTAGGNAAPGDYCTGNPGGAGTSQVQQFPLGFFFAGGGGGGAGSQGTSGGTPGTTLGAGGLGRELILAGKSFGSFGGGGGAGTGFNGSGSQSQPTGGAATAGGGQGGGSNNGLIGQNGTPNTGGGGGGAGYSSTNTPHISGNGGSGVAIIYYPTYTSVGYNYFGGTNALKPTPTVGTAPPVMVLDVKPGNHGDVFQLQLDTYGFGTYDSKKPRDPIHAYARDSWGCLNGNAATFIPDRVYDEYLLFECNTAFRDMFRGFAATSEKYINQLTGKSSTYWIHDFVLDPSQEYKPELPPAWKDAQVDNQKASLNSLRYLPSRMCSTDDYGVTYLKYLRNQDDVVYYWTITSSETSRYCLWDPVQSIVIEGNTVPVSSDNLPVSQPIVTQTTQPAYGDSRVILSEFFYPSNPAEDTIIYEPQNPRLIHLSAGTELKFFSYRIGWRNKFTGEIIPLVLSSTGAACIVFMFISKM